MKANELRIGNLINKWILGEYVPYKVDIDCLENIGDTNFDVQPIVLTEEWLLKFKFRGQFYFYHDNFCCKLEKLTKGWEARFIVAPNVSRILTHINYVHELQNLYYCLTGQELEINTYTQTL